MAERKASVGYEDWLVVFPRGEYGDRDYFVVMEKHNDGSVTSWVRNFGTRGTLRPDVITKAITTKRERERVDSTKRFIERGVEAMDVQYKLLKARRDLRERGL